MLAEAREVIDVLPPEEAGTRVFHPGGGLFRGAPAAVREAVARGRLAFHRGSIRGAQKGYCVTRALRMRQTIPSSTPYRGARKQIARARPSALTSLAILPRTSTNPRMSPMTPAV